MIPSDSKSSIQNLLTLMYYYIVYVQCTRSGTSAHVMNGGNSDKHEVRLHKLTMLGLVCEGFIYRVVDEI